MTLTMILSDVGSISVIFMGIKILNVGGLSGLEFASGGGITSVILTGPEASPVELSELRTTGGGGAVTWKSTRRGTQRFASLHMLSVVVNTPALYGLGYVSRIQI